MKKTKSISFLRHASSHENETLKHFVSLLRASRTTPSLLITNPSIIGDILCCGKQLIWSGVGWNEEVGLSELGERQLRDIKVILEEEEFWKGTKKMPDLVVVSPLYRAQRTIEVVKPSPCDNGKKTAADNKKSHLGQLDDNKNEVTIADTDEDELSLGNIIEIVTLDCLREATMLDEMMPSKLKERVQTFESWLAAQTAKRIIVVGHCQFFRFLLGQTFFMRNCDVWEAEVTFHLPAPNSDQNLETVWGPARLLHRTFLSEPHPLFDSAEEETAVTSRGDHDTRSNDQEKDQDSNEPVCRYCLMTARESPESPLIRPCLCSGSASYIHVSCLNTWRRTSVSAYEQCAVCNFRYKTVDSKINKIVTSANFAIIMTVFAIIMIAGIVEFGAFSWGRRVDLSRYIVRELKLDQFTGCPSYPYYYYLHQLSEESIFKRQHALFCAWYYQNPAVTEKSFVVSLSEMIALYIPPFLVGLVTISALGCVQWTVQSALDRRELFQLALTGLSLSTMPLFMQCRLGIIIGGVKLALTAHSTIRRLCREIGQAASGIVIETHVHQD